MPAGRRIHGIPVTKIPSARIHSSSGLFRRLTALLAALFVAGSAWGASPIPSVSSDEAISVQQIEAAIAAVEAREGLDEETRTKVLDQLRDAQAQLQNTKAAQAAEGRPGRSSGVRRRDTDRACRNRKAPRRIE
jgi:hypothetical protein